MSAPNKAPLAGAGPKGPGPLYTSESILNTPPKGGVEQREEIRRVVQSAPTVASFKGKRGKN